MSRATPLEELARAAYPRNLRCQAAFARGYQAEYGDAAAAAALVDNDAERQGRWTARQQRERVALAIASPKRAEPGRYLTGQADAGHLPLFIAAAEPAFL